jgi:RNA polymerase sigma-70 factor (ECF subfamily)
MSNALSGPSPDGHGRRLASGRFARRPPAAYLRSDLLGQAIERAKAGDIDALHFLYVRFADDVCGYVAGIVRDQHEAEDITHTLFINLPTKIQRYEQRDVPVAAWILRLARNAALHHLRARRDAPIEDLRTSNGGREDEDLERSQSLRSAFDGLPLEQREVLVLRHIAGLTPVEIAQRLGKTESSIQSLHHQARGGLQAALREVDTGPLRAGA